MNLFGGINIIKSDLFTKIMVPVRQHKRQRWDRSGSYHRRVQKKWNLRFGVKHERRAIFDKTRNTMYVSHEDYEAMLRDSGPPIPVFVSQERDDRYDALQHLMAAAAPNVPRLP
jgi:hypothetical protein